MRNAIPIIPSPNLVRVSMTSEEGGGERVVSLGVAVVIWFMLSSAASSVNACTTRERFRKKVIFTCRVSPKRMVKIGMKEPQPKAIVRATTMRKVSMGEANLNWKMILSMRQLSFVLPIQKDPLTVLDLTRPPFCHPLLFPP